MTRRKQSGFTMIEILIAIIVMVVGIVGILVLFPAGIASATRAAQVSTSGIIAESVEEALRDALRTATMQGGRLRAKLIHAGRERGSGPIEYEFSLPTSIKPEPSATPDDRDVHPSTTSVFEYIPEDIGYVSERERDALRRDHYGQYSYNFSVIRRSTNLYEFWITVYRHFPRTGTEEQRLRSVIRQYSCLISAPFSSSSGGSQ